MFSQELQHLRHFLLEPTSRLFWHHQEVTGYNTTWALRWACCCSLTTPELKQGIQSSKTDYKQASVKMNEKCQREKVTSDQQTINSLMSHWQERKHIISLTLKLRLTRAVFPKSSIFQLPQELCIWLRDKKLGPLPTIRKKGCFESWSLQSSFECVHWTAAIQHE